MRRTAYAIVASAEYMCAERRKRKYNHMTQKKYADEEEKNGLKDGRCQAKSRRERRYTMVAFRFTSTNSGSQVPPAERGPPKFSYASLRKTSGVPRTLCAILPAKQENIKKHEIGPLREEGRQKKSGFSLHNCIQLDTL